MKVLRANIFMLLPDDFEGTFDEALALWTALKNSPNPPAPNPNLSPTVSHEALFYNARYGLRTVAEIGVWKLEDRLWERSDVPPESCLHQGLGIIK